MIETNGERLNRIASDWYNEDSIDNEDVNWLIEQAERTNNLEIEYENGLLQYQLVKDSNRVLAEENARLREAENLVKTLYVGLGISIEGDHKLWKKTEAYVKSLEGESK